LFNYILVFVLTICSVAVILALGVYYFISTPAGVSTVVNYAVLQSAKYASVEIESIEGTWDSGVSLKNVTVRNWPAVPKGIILLQRVDVRFSPWDYKNVYVNFFNGRLNIPGCDVVFFNGNYTDHGLHINANSRALDVATIMRPFLDAEVMRYLKGDISDVQLALQGSLKEPRIRGFFYVDRIEYGQSDIKEGQSRFDLTFKSEKEPLEMTGYVSLENGIVHVQGRYIDLLPSRAEFKGQADNPTLSILGTTKADQYTIDFKISGTLAHPEIAISSDPYMSEEQALLVLGWGNWAPSYDSGSQRLGLNKKVIGNVRIGVALEPLRVRPGQQAEYSKKLEGQLPLTDRFSFTVAESVLDGDRSQQGFSNQDDPRREGESEFYLKYRNMF
jgi:autotransporter translocation and assembly factor TamB